MIAVDSFFPITGPCVTSIDGRLGSCDGGRRKFMTWVHTPSADPAAIVVMLAWQPGDADREKDAEVSYGDKHLLLRKQLARDNTGLHDGAVSIYTLTSEEEIPTGPQRVRVNFTDDNGPRIAMSVALTCASDKWIGLVDSAKHTGPSLNPQVLLTNGATFAIAGLFYGRGGPNLSQATPIAGFTRMDGDILQQGTSVGLADFIRSTSETGGTDLTCGWTLDDVGDAVGVVAAGFTEVPQGTATPGRIPFVIAQTRDGGFGDILLPYVVAPDGVIKPDDSCIVFARNGGGATIPTIGTGFTNFATGVDGQGRGWRLATRDLLNGDFNTGPWTNADTISMVIYRGASCRRGTFTGAYSTDDGNSTAYTYPALNRSVTTRRGWILSFMAYGAGGTTSFDKPRRDRRLDTVGISSELQCEFVAVAHTPLPVTTLASDVAGMEGASGRFTSLSVEVIADYKIIGDAGPWVWEITDGALAPGLELDTNTGKITGTPLHPGKFAFKYLVKNNFQVIAERSCAPLISPRGKRTRTRDILLLGTSTGAIMLPDAIEDFTSSLSTETNVIFPVRGKAYAPAGTDGEVVFRRLYVSGYHRAGFGLWVVPVIDGRPLQDLRTWIHRPAPPTGQEERFHEIITLGREDPEYPDVNFAIRGAVAEIYVETTDPEARVHLEAAAWAHEPITAVRIRRVGEAE